MPLAAHAVWESTELLLSAAWGEAEPVAAGAPAAALVRASARAAVSTLAQAERLGEQVAQQLRDGGARAAPASA